MNKNTFYYFDAYKEYQVRTEGQKTLDEILKNLEKQVKRKQKLERICKLEIK